MGSTPDRYSPPNPKIEMRDPLPGVQEESWQWSNFIDPAGATPAERAADATRLRAGMDYLAQQSSVAKFISTPELIRAVAAEVKQYGEILPDDSPPATPQELASMRDDAFTWAAEAGLLPDNDYHSRAHVEGMVNRAMALIAEFNSGSQERKISRAEAEGLALAAVVHDTGHEGLAKRVSQTDNLTTEQHAANIADEEARRRGYSVHVRQQIARVILSTSFWEHMKNPEIKPQTVVERLFQQADIAGYVYEPEHFSGDRQFDQELPKEGKSPGERESNLQWLKESFQVSREWARNKVIPAAASIEEWLNGQQGFIYYLRMQHDAMVRAAFPDRIQETSGEDIVVDPEWIWERRLREKEKLVPALAAYFDTVKAAAAAGSPEPGVPPQLEEEVAFVKQHFEELQALQRAVDSGQA